MPRRPAPLPPDLPDSFRVGDALDSGITPGRLRTSDLGRPFRGVRSRTSVPQEVGSEPGDRDRAARSEVLERARAYALVMPERAFFTARTAAALHHAPLAAGGPLDVGVLAPARAPRARGVRGISVERRLVEVGAVEGVPVADPPSCWAALGRDLDVRDLVVVGDAFVREPRDDRGRLRPDAATTTLERLAAAAAVGPRRGAARLRCALRLIRVGSSSPLETELRLDLQAAGAPTPELDAEIHDAGGVLLGISEFAYREPRIVVEVEGDHHRTSRRQWNRDLDKYAAYADAGWEVVRVTGQHIRSARAVPLVRAAFARRARA